MPIRAIVIAAALLGTAVYANGDERSAVSNEAPIFGRERFSGDWWGLRSDLEEAGIAVGGAYIVEFSTVLDGGVSETGYFRNLLTLDAEFDLDTILGLEGGSVFIQYLSVNGESGGTRDSGDLQVYSNIESDRHLDVLYEAWYQQQLFDGRLRLKLGKVDANSEFAFVDIAGDFSNSSAGFSPTILAFPSYPDPATSVNAFFTLVEEEAYALTFGYGLYDGALQDGVNTGSRGPSSFFDDDASDAIFHAGQAELAWDRSGDGRSWFTGGRLSAGVWHHTADFERFDGGTDDGTTGFFLTGEARLFDPDAGDAQGPDRGVYLFAQYGWADEEVSEVTQHFGGGLVWRGPWEGRPDDSLGLYASLAALSDETGAGFDDDELALSAYYRVQLSPAVFVQPEIQFIENPSGSDAIDDALVLGLRVGIEF